MTTLSFDDLHPGNALFHALLRSAPAVSHLLAHPLRSEAGLRSAARAASARALDRRELAASLAAAHRARGAPPEAMAALDRLAEPGSVVVVAGQQPALFGGAHLVLSKALAAVATALRVARDCGVPAVPVFWNATEDHDHGEVDHVSFPVRDGEPTRLRAALPADGTTLAAATLPDDFDVALATFRDLVPDGPGRADVLDAIRPEPGDSWGTAVSRLLLRLLGPLGLVVVEPRDLRRLAIPVLEFEMSRPGRISGLVGDAEAGLAAAGFAPVLGPMRDEMFFALRDGRRVRVPFADGRYELPAGERVSPPELVRVLRDDPQRFSWNVVTRVLAQDLALPVAAQVCGPSELAYVALTRPAHDELGLTVPALIPRPGVTVVDPHVARAARSEGRSIADLIRLGVDAWPPVSGSERSELAQLVAALEALPASAEKGVVRRRQALDKAVHAYGEALRRADAARADTTEARRRRVLGAVRPSGLLQERHCSWLGWLAAHGRPLLDAWLEAVDGLDAGHTLLHTGELGGKRDG